jgi:hypothetical protein
MTMPWHVHTAWPAWDCSASTHLARWPHRRNVLEGGVLWQQLWAVLHGQAAREEAVTARRCARVTCNAIRHPSTCRGHDTVASTQRSSCATKKLEQSDWPAGVALTPWGVPALKSCCAVVAPTGFSACVIGALGCAPWAPLRLPAAFNAGCLRTARGCCCASSSASARTAALRLGV